MLLPNICSIFTILKIIPLILFIDFSSLVREQTNLPLCCLRFSLGLSMVCNSAYKFKFSQECTTAHIYIQSKHFSHSKTILIFSEPLTNIIYQIKLYLIENLNLENIISKINKKPASQWLRSNKWWNTSQIYNVWVYYIHPQSDLSFLLI